MNKLITICFLFMLTGCVFLQEKQTINRCPSIPSYFLEEIPKEDKLKDLTVGSIIDQSIQRKELLEQCKTQIIFIKKWNETNNEFFNN